MKLRPAFMLGSMLLVSSTLFAQGRSFVGSSATGKLTLTTTVNLMQAGRGLRALTSLAASPITPSTEWKIVPFLRAPVLDHQPTQGPVVKSAASPRAVALSGTPAAAASVPLSLAVNPVSTAFGFDGITHAQMRLADNGNQFSIEPPSPNFAVGNGYVLQGVNNGVQVYTTAGVPLLASALTSNQVFGLPPSINRTTGVFGVYTTDMRIFFDHSINRWFILQRSQDNDALGNPLQSSHIYLAVSQSSDPTATYNIYTMDTTNSANLFNCPCFPDYMQIGADQYGFYIAANEYNAFSTLFRDAFVLAISKTSLASGSAAPTAFQFTIPFSTGYNFAIQPASTPPGASYFLGSGGVEFFVSTSTQGNGLAVWAMSNTSSLLTQTPNLQLVQTVVPSLTYGAPDYANQKPGPMPFGASQIPPRTQPLLLDAGDSRIQSLYYSGGRLYTAWMSQLTDDAGRSRVGTVYAILAPSVRAGTLAAPISRQGYLVVNNNHLLAPAIAVNPQGRGAIVFTLVGPDHYPSAAFLPIDVASTSSTIQIARAGVAPEDGFSGFSANFGVARWGDYSVAVAASDGSIWMGTEYIPNAVRTPLANWGTYLFRYTP